MNTTTVYLKKSDPVMQYLTANMAGSRAVRNSANFLIRNVFTALGKDESLRTANENTVLIKAKACIKEANLRREAAHIKKIAKGEKSELKYMRIPDEKHRVLSYEQIDAILKISEDEAYFSCTSQVNQQAIRKTCKSWRSYFGAIKEWKKNPSKFTGMPRFPGYKREKLVTAHFTSQVSSFSDEGDCASISFANYKGTVNLGAIPVLGKYVKTEVSPCASGCKLLLTFDNDEIMPEAPEHPERILAVDPGVSNLATCTSNTGMIPFIVDGRYIKSVNRYYNKEKARLVSILTAGKDPKDRKVQRTSNRIEMLSEKREKIIRDYFYKAAHCICRKAKAENIQVIVFGHIPKSKQECNIGHVNNQNFVQIPHARFLKTLTWIAAKYDIAVISVDESYTSKADFFANDTMPECYEPGKEHAFSGKRVKRGLYVSSTGRIINADVNGSANILRKKYPYAFNACNTDNLLSVEKIGYRNLYPVVRKEKPVA